MGSLSAVVASYRAAIQPAASDEAFAVALDELLRFARAFNVALPARRETDSRAPVTVITEIYRQAMDDLPEDLIVLAVRRAVKTWTWGNRLPMPGDLRKLVADDLHQRRRDLARAEAALRKVAATAPIPSDPTPEELAAVEAAMARLEAPPTMARRVPVERDDGIVIGAEPISAVRSRVAAELAGRAIIDPRS